MRTINGAVASFKGCQILTNIVQQHNLYNFINNINNYNEHIYES